MPLVAAMILAAGVPTRSENELVGTYAIVRHSIALVAAELDERHVVTGTAFCVSSDGRHSVFVTNRHVVSGSIAIGLYMQNPKRLMAPARIVRIGTDADVALVEVKTGNIPAVTLAARAPRSGTAVAVAGYPNSQIELSRAHFGLSPSVHAGIVNALLSRRSLIVFDARIEEGSSGSPLFDPVSAVVYGVAEGKWGHDQTNIAVSAEVVRAIARNAHVALRDVVVSPAPSARPSVPEPAPLPS